MSYAPPEIIVYHSPTQQVIANMMFDFFASGTAVWFFVILLLVFIGIAAATSDKFRAAFRRRRNSRGK